MTRFRADGKVRPDPSPVSMRTCIGVTYRKVVLWRQAASRMLSAR